MDELVQNVMGEILAGVVVFVFLLILSMVILFIPSQWRKAKLFHFFGISANDPKFQVYFSVINVLQPHTTGTFRFDLSSDNILTGAFVGPAIPEGELLVSKYVVDCMQPDLLDNLPTSIRKKLEKRFRWFKRLELTLSASPLKPLPAPDFQFCPLLAVGSGTYNSVSAYYTERHPGYLKLTFQPEYAVEVIKGSRKGEKFTPKHPDGQPGGMAILEKVYDAENENVAFVASGAGVGGSIAGVLYLMFAWEELARKYHDKPFAVFMEVDLTQTTSERGLKGLKFHQLEFFPMIT